MKKADWVIVMEAENKGLIVSMTNIHEPVRTELNNKLNKYFRSAIPEYSGGYDEYEGEDILYSINEYMEDKKIDKYPLDFPLSEGTDIHLIPITENLHLKVVVADEYYGGGDYSKYVMVDSFMINENTTEKDVDVLIDFVKEYLK